MMVADQSAVQTLNKCKCSIHVNVTTVSDAKKVV